MQSTFLLIPDQPQLCQFSYTTDTVQYMGALILAAFMSCFLVFVIVYTSVNKAVTALTKKAGPELKTFCEEADDLALYKTQGIFYYILNLISLITLFAVAVIMWPYLALPLKIVTPILVLAQAFNTYWAWLSAAYKSKPWDQLYNVMKK